MKAISFFPRKKKNIFAVCFAVQKWLSCLSLYFDHGAISLSYNIFLSVNSFHNYTTKAFLTAALRAAAASRPFCSGILAPPPHPIKRVGAAASASVSFRDGIASRFGFTLQIHTINNFTFWQVFFTLCNLTEILRKITEKLHI